MPKPAKSAKSPHKASSQSPRFDPDAAAQPGTGVFGLPFERAASRIVLYPVPFDATTSYGKGTAGGPAAILEASAQVDLFDLRFGRIYERGIFMADPDPRIAKLNRRATALAAPIIKKGGAGPRDVARMKQINAACEDVNEIVRTHTASVLGAGKIPGLVGGEHAMSFGAIRACTDAHGEIGILQIDAHMDLRDAFEGFRWSHASIMHNVLSELPRVTKLVQVGIRDFGERELEFSRSQGSRVVVCFDEEWSDRAGDGAKFSSLVDDALRSLPEKVYVSFDIDGLEPALCPHTGTPVPGGLKFAQAALILDRLRKSERTVVGFDLVEVAPGPDDQPELDANVGSRILYKLCGIC